MKIKYINEITRIVGEFYNKVITFGESMPDNMLRAHIEEYAHIATESEDCIDIDYDDMCFTVYKNENGLWELCENASYYTVKNGFLDTPDGVIDVELN